MGSKITKNIVFLVGDFVLRGLITILPHLDLLSIASTVTDIQADVAKISQHIL